MAKFGELSYAEMLQAIIQAAEQRLDSSRVSSLIVCVQESVAAWIIYMQWSFLLNK